MVDGSEERIGREEEYWERKEKNRRSGEDCKGLGLEGRERNEREGIGRRWMGEEEERREQRIGRRKSIV